MGWFVAVATARRNRDPTGQASHNRRDCIVPLYRLGLTPSDPLRPYTKLQQPNSALLKRYSE